MAVYQELFKSGELADRVRKAHSFLENCRLCGHACRVNRLAGVFGKCGTGKETVVSSYGPHFGEESPLVGRHGSGTVFFTNCNLKCIYCQTISVSWRSITHIIALLKFPNLPDLYQVMNIIKL